MAQTPTTAQTAKEGREGNWMAALRDIHQVARDYHNQLQRRNKLQSGRRATLLLYTRYLRRNTSGDT